MFRWLRKLAGKTSVMAEVMPQPDRSHGLVDLTEWERGFIQRTRGKCPDCEVGEMYQGPRGGLSVNVRCGSCSAKFNLAVVNGQVLFAQRIGVPTVQKRGVR